MITYLLTNIFSSESTHSDGEETGDGAITGAEVVGFDVITHVSCLILDQH
jgi:hypothetical protein